MERAWERVQNAGSITAARLPFRSGALCLIRTCLARANGWLRLTTTGNSGNSKGLEIGIEGALTTIGREH